MRVVIPVVRRWCGCVFYRAPSWCIRQRRRRRSDNAGQIVNMPLHGTRWCTQQQWLSSGHPCNGLHTATFQVGHDGVYGGVHLGGCGQGSPAIMCSEVEKPPDGCSGGLTGGTECCCNVVYLLGEGRGRVCVETPVIYLMYSVYTRHMYIYYIFVDVHHHPRTTPTQVCTCALMRACVSLRSNDGLACTTTLSNCNPKPHCCRIDASDSTSAVVGAEVSTVVGAEVSTVVSSGEDDARAVVVVMGVLCSGVVAMVNVWSMSVNADTGSMPRAVKMGTGSMPRAINVSFSGTRGGGVR